MARPTTKKIAHRSEGLPGPRPETGKSALTILDGQGELPPMKRGANKLTANGITVEVVHVASGQEISSIYRMVVFTAVFMGCHLLLAATNNAVDALNTKTRLAYSERNYATALKDSEELIKLGDTNAYLIRSYVLYDMHSNDEAFVAAEQAVKIVPSAETYNWRAFLYNQVKNDYRRALADYTRAIALNPLDYNGYYNRASLYLIYLQSNNLAIADYKSAIKLINASTNLYGLRDSYIGIALEPVNTI